ncbi:MAG: Exopolyphosphatase family protein [Candidatus Curtissbacteria bacterium GW2011_GWA1_40_16]|uniref:Exopolyphosphatase family protein n=1 Tax=Candidatus Curtissbacteria bacterium GW2011_GWA1_40_16 TaxID=1618405 RepID=A0A0G0UJR0_9BACT|nr:MAG: Exopolyphosphatase family protein [Candidatus Curtissbacteria bacterium GW2011_GWA1_40_16]
MDDYLKQQTLDKITKANKIIIVVSRQAALDGLASGLALYLSLSKLGKPSSIIAKSPTVEEANKLYGVDKIGKNDDKKNLVINVENAVTNVDKVTYSLQDSRLKIVVHSLPNSFGISESDVSFSKEGSNPDLVIAIGYKSNEEMRNDITHEQTINSDTFIININNTQTNQNFAQINILEDGAASISEVTTKLLQELALPIDEDVAFNLYTGISYATQSFSPAYATPVSFEAAQWLIKFGAGKASFANTTTSQNMRPEQATNEKVNFIKETGPIQEEVTIAEKSQEDWLKPPKIYHGSKAFDTDS